MSWRTSRKKALSPVTPITPNVGFTLTDAIELQDSRRDTDPFVATPMADDRKYEQGYDSEVFSENESGGLAETSRALTQQWSHERSRPRLDRLKSSSRTATMRLLLNPNRERSKTVTVDSSFADSVKKAKGKLLPKHKRYLHKVHWLTDGEDLQEAFLDWEPAQLFLKTQAVDKKRKSTKVFAVEEYFPDFSEMKLGTDLLKDTGEMPVVTAHSGDGRHGPTSSFQIFDKKLSAMTNRHMTAAPIKGKDKDGAEPNYLFPNEHSKPLTDDNGKLKPLAKSRRIVFVDMKLKRLSDIDTSKLTFRCKFHFYLTWMAKYKEVQSWFLWEYRKKKKDEDDDEQWEPEWKPRLAFTNAVKTYQYGPEEFKLKSGWHRSFTPPKGDDTDTSELMYKGSSWDIRKEDLGCDPRDAYWIRVRYNAEFTFSEELELNAFPFDCQNFSIFIKMDSDKTSEADLLPFPRLGEFMLLDKKFSVLNEWTIHNVVCEWKHTDPAESKAFLTYPLLAVHIKAARKWKARISFVLVTLCMQTLGLCAFAISTEESIGERMSYCVMLLLADVTLLQLMFDQLPTISYITVLDQTMWFCFGFLFLVTIWSAIDGDLPYFSSDKSKDDSGFVFFSVVYVASVVYFTYVSMFVRRMEMKKHSMTEEELDALDKDRDRRWMWNSHADERYAVKLAWNREMVYDEKNRDKRNIVTHATPSVAAEESEDEEPEADEQSPLNL